MDLASTSVGASFSKSGLLFTLLWVVGGAPQLVCRLRILRVLRYSCQQKGAASAVISEGSRGVVIEGGLVILGRSLHAQPLIPRYVYVVLGSQNTNKHDLSRKWTQYMTSDVTFLLQQCPGG